MIQGTSKRNNLRSINLSGVASVKKYDEDEIYTYNFEDWWWEDSFLVLVTEKKRVYISRDVIEDLELDFEL